jgi:outer membrane receptor protein involved in Fe transport
MKCGIALAAALPLLAPGVTLADEALIVTGERRPQEASGLAASVAVIDARELRRIAADHASEVLARAAGVLIHRGSGQEHLTAIRSPVLTGGAGAGSFLFLEDGVPLRSAGFANVNALFEAHTETADRIEVVRGPSGALYGANAIHGVVNVLTPRPGEGLEGFIAASGDTVERFKGSAAISDTFGADGLYGAVSLLSEAGYRIATGADQQKATLRHVHEARWGAVSTVFAAINLNQETGGFVVGPDAYLDPALRRANANPEAFRDAKSFRLHSRIDFEASDDVRVSVTPFARWTEQSFLLHFFPSRALEENGHWSVGAQSAVYSDPPSDIALIAGADWEYTEGYLRETQSIPTIGTFTQGLHYDYRVTAVSASPFLQASIKFSPRLTFVGAARLDWTRYDYDNRAPDGVVGRFLRPPDRADSFVTVSPKASLLYDLDNGALRASYARGARPPQTADLYRLQPLQIADAADPEFIDAFEIGWRGSIGDRIDFDVAGYFMAKRNFFFRDADGFNVDDGKTRHVGFEAEATLRPVAEVTLGANVAYGRHTYRFRRPVMSVPQASEAIAKGDDVDTAPRWLAGARALWAPAALPLEAEFEWLLVGRYFTDAANSTTYPGHNLLNLRLALDVAEGLQLSCTVRNLLDTLYAERADFAFGEERYFPGEERAVSVGLRATL